MKIYSFILLQFFWLVSLSQTVVLPLDFETGSVVAGDYTNFDGGIGSVVANPSIDAMNPSATVGQIIRNGGQPWAGAFLTSASNLDFSVNPIICMKVYTDAPVGTNISLKMEGCGGGCSFEIAAFTTVSGQWETLCYDFTGQPASFDRLVFLFDLGNVGNGSATSTFFFDCVEQYATLPLLLTPGSQYFCPSASLNMTYPGPGNYNWYADAAGTILLQASSNTYTTSVLTADSSFYVKDMDSSPVSPTDFGPTIPGGTAIGNSLTVSTFFTSNLDNGFFYSVDILFHIPTGPPPLNTCTYQVDLFNITQGTSRTLTQNFVAPVNFSQHAYTFGTPLPIFLNDQLEMRITSLTGHPCYCISSGAGDNGLFLPFPNSYHPQITFTGHTSNGVPNVLMSGQDYHMSGDFVDPTLAQVNAIDNCALAPLFTKKMDLTVYENKEVVRLNWFSTSSSHDDYFIVNRSKEGRNFEQVDRVPFNQIDVSSHTYSFTDNDPWNGRSYYQIEQVHKDGSTTISETVSVLRANSSDFQLFPNPTTGTVRLSTDYELNLPVDIYLQNTMGKTVEHFKSIKTHGAFEHVMDVSHLPQGIYSVTLRTQKTSKVIKLLKK